LKTTDQEYFEFCIRDAAQEVGKGLLIYVVALGAFWLTIG
jgi:hypothetical protein